MAAEGKVEKLNITLWNTEWAKPGTRRGELVRAALAGGGPDVNCVTEGYAGILPEPGYTITSHEDYGYAVTEGRRKVLLWSKQPWREIDQLGSASMPSGRFICGTTETPLGPVRV